MPVNFKWTAILVLAVAGALIAGDGQHSGTTSRRSTHSGRTGTAAVSPSLAAAARPFQATGCDDSLWTHVYHPQRLKVIEKCISVTGTIHHIKKEADGDDHIQLTLDPKYASLLNDRNKTAQAGCLILEPICENPVTQTDAIPACRDFHSSVAVASKGAHVRVLGTYILDSEPNHGWTEIHPVTSISPE